MMRCAGQGLSRNHPLKFRLSIGRAPLPLEKLLCKLLVFGHLRAEFLLLMEPAPCPDPALSRNHPREAQALYRLNTAPCGRGSIQVAALRLKPLDGGSG